MAIVYPSWLLIKQRTPVGFSGHYQPIKNSAIHRWLASQNTSHAISAHSILKKVNGQYIDIVGNSYSEYINAVATDLGAGVSHLYQQVIPDKICKLCIVLNGTYTTNKDLLVQISTKLSSWFGQSTSTCRYACFGGTKTLYVIYQDILINRATRDQVIFALRYTFGNDLLKDEETCHDFPFLGYSEMVICNECKNAFPTRMECLQCNHIGMVIMSDTQTSVVHLVSDNTKRFVIQECDPVEIREITKQTLIVTETVSKHGSSSYTGPTVRTGTVLPYKQTWLSSPPISHPNLQDLVETYLHEVLPSLRGSAWGAMYMSSRYIYMTFSSSLPCIFENLQGHFLYLRLSRSRRTFSIDVKCDQCKKGKKMSLNSVMERECRKLMTTDQFVSIRHLH